MDVALVRELFEDLFVHPDDKVGFAFPFIEGGQVEPVPVVLSVQFHGFPQVLFGPVEVPQADFAQSQIIIYGVIVRFRPEEGIENRAGFGVVAVFKKGDGIDQPVVDFLCDGSEWDEGTDYQAYEEFSSCHSIKTFPVVCTKIVQIREKLRNLCG